SALSAVRPHEQAREPHRRLPVGAEIQVDGGVHFRVWAPRRKQVEVVFSDGRGTDGNGADSAIALAPEDDGYFSGHAPQARAGDLYGFRLENEAKLYPDPASRFQPDGPHGLSTVVDPASYRWCDGDWRGVDRQGQIAYEMHVGTFTPEGTFAA